MKESTIRTSETVFDEVANANIPLVSYELPDGQTIEIGSERFRIAELLFNPEPLNKLNNNAQEHLLWKLNFKKKIHVCTPSTVTKTY